VTHALEFVRHPRALDLWRDAAAGRFPAETSASVATMLEFIRQAIDRGDWNTVSAVCDCLFDLYDPGTPRVHIGGIRRHPPADR
jgi:hypothetical protein